MTALSNSKTKTLGRSTDISSMEINGFATRVQKYIHTDIHIRLKHNDNPATSYKLGNRLAKEICSIQISEIRIVSQIGIDNKGLAIRT